MQKEAKLRIVRNKEQEKTSHEKIPGASFYVDGTLLDFDKAERIGIDRVLTHFGEPGYRGECRSTTI